VIIAGIKTATVEVIASATLAAFIGAGGLAPLSSLALRFMTMPFSSGAIPVALLALIAEVSLTLQRTVYSHLR